MDKLRLSLAFQQTIQLILRQPYVKRQIGELKEERESTLAVFEFEIELPSRAEKQGITKTGVRKLEPVYFFFPYDYPRRPPFIKLRKDFNRALPHVNPGQEGEYVCPCFYDGSLNELYHQENGLTGILRQIYKWLYDAAGDELTDPSQGWEPTRRDYAYGSCLVDRRQLSEKMTQTKKGCKLINESIIKISDGYILARHHSFTDSSTPRIRELFEKNRFLGILIWSDKVISTYQPETINDLSDLLQRLNELGVRTQTEKGLKNISDYWCKHLPISKSKFIPFVFSIGIMRPCNMIGTNERIEILSYFGELTIHAGKFSLDSKIFPLYCIEFSTPSLMRRLSGFKMKSVFRVVCIGVGSLGSKIAMHLGRIGVEKMTIYDKDIFQPHNNARHAATDNLGSSKVSMMEVLMSPIGLDLKAKDEDILKDLGEKDFHQNDLIVDSTASLSVFNALCDHKGKIGRIIHVALKSKGKFSLMLVEGPGRSVRLDDLRNYLFDQCLEDELLQWYFFGDEDSTQVPIGEGCSSRTMIMSDAAISLPAASMSTRISQLLEENYPSKGEINLGYLQDDQMSLSWCRKYLDASQVVKNEVQKNDWGIRILNPAHLAIQEEIRKFGHEETGGILIGHVSNQLRCVTITRFITPSVCVRSPSKFTFQLDKETRNQIDSFEKKTNCSLTVLGTWHSHPRGGTASSIDINMLSAMKSWNKYIPSTLLISTPTGYFGYVDGPE